MHGRPRQAHDALVDPEKQRARERKLQLFRKLTDDALDVAARGASDAEALAATARLLKANPEVYTVWNHRRRVFQRALQGDGDARALAREELALSEAALRENPKSYAAWHHRLWVVRQGLASPGDELQLVDKLLQLDTRNFHAWRYRSEVAARAGAAPEEQLAGNRALIDANFSNFSAWHARTRLLQQLHESARVVPFAQLLAAEQQRIADAAPAAAAAEPAPAVPMKAIEAELELAQQAFFTDPEDQSAYMYHAWLLQQARGHWRAGCAEGQRQAAGQALGELLEREEGRCRELLAVEPERSRCKWPLLSLARLLQLRREAGLAPDAANEAAAIYRELAEIDPLRRGFYADAAQGL